MKAASKLRKKSIGRRTARYGLMFSMPFIIGFVFMYLIPLSNSVRYAFSKVMPGSEGVKTEFIGFDNFGFAFTGDADFIKKLAGSLGSTLFQIPVIIIFSLFIAMMLNHKFHGRTLVRAIFFLPVIVASGVVINIMTGDLYASVMQGGRQSSSMMQSTVLRDILSVYGMAEETAATLTGFIDTIFQLAWKSGIQILLFLAGIQSIGRPLYESSSIDGASAWENFWFITLPMISPILIVNCVYTIIDGFTDYSNELMQHIYAYANKLEYGTSSAMAWIYFAIVAIIVGIVFAVINKRAFSAV